MSTNISISFPNRYVLAVTVSLVTLSLVIGCDGPTGSLDPRMAPRNLEASFDGDSVVLEWDPSELGTEESYEVWRNEYGNEYEKIADLNSSNLSYDDREINSGLYYNYKIKAIYYGGNWADSSEISSFTGYLLLAGWKPPEIYKINPVTGTVLETIPTPCGMPTGLAWDGTYLWTADYWDGSVNKIDINNGTVISSFNPPGETPRGLAWDGSYIWVSDYLTEMIYKIDPSTGTVILSFTTPGEYPTGLTWSAESIISAGYYRGDIHTCRLFKIDPNTGKEVSYVQCQYYNPKGLAWDGVFLWNVESDCYGVHKIDPSTDIIADSFPSPTDTPEGLTILSSFN